MPVGHVILLGDSIFDNARYVPGGLAVIEHLRKCLPSGWRATLLAVDGSVASGVSRQLAALPADATHLVVSTGGNNALEQASTILHERAASYAEVLSHLADIRADFQREYRAMLDAVVARGKPVAVCTVYDSIPGLECEARAGLALFNEVILREAIRAGVPVIDLRLICDEASDYSPMSPIEPSATGGAKVARAVNRAVTGTGPAHGSVVFS
jgi:hypothetical protein